jgi:chemotaxis protein methyltransferase CheR
MTLRRMIQFGHHDLLADNYNQGEYDLVLCRNVLIYFTEEAKDRIYRGFFRSLKPGGYLFVGGTERISDHRGMGFELVMPFFYRKP